MEINDVDLNLFTVIKWTGVCTNTGRKAFVLQRDKALNTRVVPFYQFDRSARNRHFVIDSTFAIR